MRYFSSIAFLTVCCSISNAVFSQDSADSSLDQRIEILELKLQLAEQQMRLLNEECKALWKENATRKNKDADQLTPANDQFAPGVVWVGISKALRTNEVRWAISISKRDGYKLEGVVATQSPSGDSIEFSVTGKAPPNGDGLVVIAKKRLLDQQSHP